MSPLAGTSPDPFNQAVSFALVENLQKLGLCEGFGVKWWDFFTRELLIWDADDVVRVLGKKENVC